MMEGHDFIHFVGSRAIKKNFFGLRLNFATTFLSKIAKKSSNQGN